MLWRGVRPALGLADRLLEVLGGGVFPGGFAAPGLPSGVYGLAVAGSVLYFTLVPEAAAFFADAGGVRRVYRYELVGVAEPRAGGDSYNASVAVDDTVFFGGWVYAPLLYRHAGGSRTIDHRRRFSHLHAYVASEDRVVLVWQESLGDSSRWAGTVSSIVYDPLGDRLLVARGEGHDRLGVYEAQARPVPQQLRPVVPIRSLHGAAWDGEACFTIHRGASNTGGWVCVELGSRRPRYRVVEAPGDYAAVSSDGHGAWGAVSGWAAAAGGVLYAGLRGGLLSLRGEEAWFHRLLDLPGSCLEATAATGAAGGVAAAWGPGRRSGGCRCPAPGLLVGLAGDNARVLAVLGGRPTSLLWLGGDLVAATAPLPGPVGSALGARGLVPLSLGSLASGSPPPVSLCAEPPPGRVWGGVPLEGYREPRLVLWGCGEGARVTVYTYRLSTPPGGAEVDRYSLAAGERVLGLGGHVGGIVSFHVEGCRPSRVEVVLS